MPTPLFDSTTVRIQNYSSEKDSIAFGFFSPQPEFKWLYRDKNLGQSFARSCELSQNYYLDVLKEPIFEIKYCVPGTV